MVVVNIFRITRDALMRRMRPAHRQPFALFNESLARCSRGQFRNSDPRGLFRHDPFNFARFIDNFTIAQLLFKGEHMHERRGDRRSEWNFEITAKGWQWAVTRPGGTQERSSTAYETLKQAGDDAVAHGYGNWRSLERRAGDRRELDH